MLLLNFIERVCSSGMHQKSITAWLTRIGLGLILLSPLYFSPATIFPFTVIKATLVHIGIGAVVMAAILNSYSLRSQIPIYPLTVGLILLLAIQTVAGVFGTNFELSFFSTFERSQGIYGLSFCIALSIAIASLQTKESDWRLIFRIVVAASSAIAILALAYFAGLYEAAFLERDFGRLAFTIGNAAIFGHYLAILTTLAFALCLVDYSVVDTKIRVLEVTALVLLFFCLVATGSRGGLLAFFLSAVVVLYGSPLPRKWKLITTIAGALAILSSLLLMWDIVETRLAETTLTNQSIAYRLDAWQIGWHAIMERPWLGWGSENFIALFGQFSTAMQVPNETFDSAHNHLIAISAGTGFVGLTGYSAVILLALFVLWRGLHSTSVATSGNTQLGLAILVSYQIASFFLFEALVSQPIFFIAIGYCLYSSQPLFKVTNRIRPAFSTVLMVIIVITFLQEARFVKSASHLRSVEARSDWATKLTAANAESGGIRQEELVYLFAMETWGDWRSFSDSQKLEVRGVLENLIGDSDILRLNWRTTFHIANAYLLMVEDYPNLIGQLQLLVKRTGQLAPERPQSHRLLANYFIATNQPKEARQVLESYLKKNPDRPIMLATLEKLKTNVAH